METSIRIYIDEDSYYSYYMEWVRFHIMPTDQAEKIVLFKTQLFIHCKYKNGKIDEGRYLSPIYKTITSINNNHPEITSGYSIISFK